MLALKCPVCDVLVASDKKRDIFKNRRYCSKKCQGKAAQERYWRKKLAFQPAKGDVGPGDARL